MIMTLPARGTDAIRAASASTAPPAAREAPSAWLATPSDVVDGGEIILMAIKPSVWRPVSEALPILAGCGLLAIVVAVLSTPVPGLSTSGSMQFLAAVGVIVTAVSFARWALTWYVLTNRRVLDIQGLWAPRIWSCALLDVRNTYLGATKTETSTSTGTITFVTQRDEEPPRQWCFVAKPDEMHAKIRRAIEEAIDHHGGA